MHCLTKEGDYIIVIGHIFPIEEIEIGSKWTSNGKEIVTITDVDVDNQWVYYEGTAQPPHGKQSFAFQCRRCLIIHSYK